MNAVVLFFLVVFALSERVLNVSLGDYKIGLFDVSVAIYVLIYFLNNGRLNKSIFYLVLVVLLSQFFQGFIFRSSISYTASLTVSLKILCVVAVTSGSIRIFHMKIISIMLFVIFSFLLLFLSDGSPIFQTDWFNRNETISYSLAAIFIMPERYNKWRWSMLFFLLLFSFVVHSRQIVLSFVFGLVVMTFFATKVSLRYKILILVCFVMVSVFGYKLYLSGLDEYDARRYSIFSNINLLEIDELESNTTITQGDKFRVLNILSGFKGWMDSPLLGNGIGSYVRYNEFGKVAHNTYITLLFEGGLMFVLLFIYILRRAVDKKLRFLTYLLVFVILFNLNFIEAFGKFTIYLFFIGLSYHKKYLRNYASK